MKPSVINSDSINKQVFGEISVQELLTKETSQNLSVAIIELNGNNKKLKDKVSDRCYFVLDGEGVFVIEDVEYSVKKGDLVFIPKGTIYSDSGNLEMLSFSTPSFDPSNTEYAD